MAGSKTVPLTWGIGGKIVGTATVDENGLIVAEIEDKEVQKLFAQDNYLSIVPKDD